MSSTPRVDNQPIQTAKRSRRGLWWALGGGLLAVVLIVGAVIAIPRILHAQRVATYTELVAQTNVALSETSQLSDNADLVTVLYSLQFGEAREFQPVLEELAGFTDHYFSDDNLAALAQANSTLIAALEDEGLSEAETQTVTFAKDAIESQGYMWQTGFLNLSPDAVEELIERAQDSQVTPVPDDEVTEAVLESAKVTLQGAEADLVEAEGAFAAAQARAESLIAAVVGTLEPLRNSALGAPDQAEVVLTMYPAANQEIVKQLRDSAQFAAESVSAALFTVDDDYNPIPLAAEATEDQVSFATTDAWRPTIIATHLMSYSNAITGAWISDAGGLEAALGFNPFLPFF